MKITCGQKDFPFASSRRELGVVLYGQPGRAGRGSAGEAIKDAVKREKLSPAARAWDFLSIALSVVSADLAGHRNKSSDGWTREFELQVAIVDPGFWNTQSSTLEEMLGFLTTDRWKLRFVDQGFLAAPPQSPVFPSEDSVVLVSGGLDSFVGALDLASLGKKPMAVSQSVRGDAEKQRALASIIGGGLRQLQLNHNASVPDQEEPPTQRARSVIFVAYGVLAATSLAAHQAGEPVTLYMCENGFISINPPLTGLRLGSLSTRTSHPVVLNLLQRVFDAVGLRVRIENPYQHMTKGEMLAACRDQAALKAHAHETTSCGRFMRFNYQHCGRCVPCLIRRAAFRSWGMADRTRYVYGNLSRNDADHAGFDDVRAAAMAIAEVNQDGLDAWLGAALSPSVLRSDASALKGVVKRGLAELASLLHAYKIR
jgi:7-cyano-7-deazaguanine synthase in queuosine biosynthesis